MNKSPLGFEVPMDIKEVKSARLPIMLHNGRAFAVVSVRDSRGLVLCRDGIFRHAASGEVRLAVSGGSPVNY